MDATAGISGALGAEVIARVDPLRRGKSYAIDYGIGHLANDPPDVVIVIDADCIPDSTCLRTIGALAFDLGRPVQAASEVLITAKNPSSSMKLAAFAYRVKNIVRPRGLSYLGFPCQLMGTGMAFPWAAVSNRDLKSGALAEDLKLGLDLALGGFAPKFCQLARVTSAMPDSTEGQKTQRARWETGHVLVIAQCIPGVLLASIRRRDLSLLAMALDAAVPPLAMQALAICSLMIVSLLTVHWGGSIAPLAVNGIAATFLCLAVYVAWWRVGKGTLSLRDLGGIPAYALAKLPLYGQILMGKRVPWIRTKRD